MFRCNLPSLLLAEWPGSFTCHCSNMGVEQTPNKSQHTKLTLEKKILPPPLSRFKLATFWSRVLRTYQQAILAHTARNNKWQRQWNLHSRTVNSQTQDRVQSPLIQRCAKCSMYVSMPHLQTLCPVAEFKQSCRSKPFAVVEHFDTVFSVLV